MHRITSHPNSPANNRATFRIRDASTLGEQRTKRQCMRCSPGPRSADQTQSKSARTGQI